MLAWSEIVPMVDLMDVQAAPRALWLPVELQARAVLNAGFYAAIDAKAARGKAGNAAAKRAESIRQKWLTQAARVQTEAPLSGARGYARSVMWQM